jgi:thioredoxin-like negative regulator of GroEL
MFRLAAFGSLALILLTAPAFAAKEAPDAAKLFAEGERLLANADFEGALKAFAAASRASPKNKRYQGRAMIVKRVIRARKYVETAEIDAKWEKVAISLHAFYARERLLDEALALDRKIHEKRPSATSAALLAETLLDAGKNEEARKLLAGLPKEHKDLKNRVYEGIALARLEKTDEAKKVAAGLKIADDTRPGILFDVARLRVLLGDEKGALGMLAKCLEKTPTASQAAVRDRAKACADFASIAKKPEFTVALATKSKVKVSECSGGSDCGSCPSRGGCDSGKK